MSFVAGQGVLGRIRFVDGEVPAYDRTYLVVTAEPDYIEVLNVSSIRGKERKLAFPTKESALSEATTFTEWFSFVRRLISAHAL